MSSKIVFKINGNKDLSQISAPNVIAQLDNLKRNINQGVQYLAKKKSTVGRKEDDEKKETETNVKYWFRNLTEHMIQKINEEKEEGYIIYLEKYLALFYELINTNKGYSMGDSNNSARFLREIEDLSEKIISNNKYGTLVPLNYITEYNTDNLEDLGMRIEDYTYDRVDRILKGKLYQPNQEPADFERRDFNSNNIRKIGKYKFFFDVNKCYMLGKEIIEDTRFENEKEESKVESNPKKVESNPGMYKERVAAAKAKAMALPEAKAVTLP